MEGFVIFALAAYDWTCRLCSFVNHDVEDYCEAFAERSAFWVIYSDPIKARTARSRNHKARRMG